MEREMKTVINRLGFAAPAFAALVLASGILSAGAASNTGGGPGYDDCTIDHIVCYRSCKDLGKWCDDECDRKNEKCKPSKHSQPGSGPFTPKTGNHTPPTGGTKGEPKKPAKVNDTRAPLGGGVFGQKSPSSSGTSDPILRSSGAGQPIMKSNGGSGPNSKSGGGLR
jgi:hypothetical protein